MAGFTRQSSTNNNYHWFYLGENVSRLILNANCFNKPNGKILETRFMRLLLKITLAFFVLSNTSCSRTAEDIFAGCYSIKSGGEPGIKVENIDGTYYASMKENNVWTEGSSLRPATQDELSNLFGEDSGKIKSSLTADKKGFGLFHVTAGESFRGEVAETDYLAFILLGVGSVYKTDCTD